VNVDFVLTRIACSTFMSLPRNSMKFMESSSTDRKHEWVSDPKLRAQTDRILSMRVTDRLRQLEAEANFFDSIRPLA
jgi:hypothetical protein